MSEQINSEPIKDFSHLLPEVIASPAKARRAMEHKILNINSQLSNEDLRQFETNDAVALGESYTQRLREEREAANNAEYRSHFPERTARSTNKLGRIAVRIEPGSGAESKIKVRSAAA